MIKGLPSSGKSTIARQIVGNGKTCIRINRDDLRAMFYGSDSSWSGRKEDIVIASEKVAARTALENAFNVVIDDTNLSLHNLNMWTQFAKDCNAKFDVIDLTMVSVDECIARDKIRDKRVGRAVIENMALRYNLLPRLSLRKKITIWDLDGTVANISHRLNRLDCNGNIIHPTALKAEAMRDSLNTPIADWLCSTQKDYVVFIVSGRGTDEAIVTEDWLSSHSVFPDRLFMRQGGDLRADTIIKKEILDRIDVIYGKESVEWVVDDRPCVCALWRENGLKVFPVNQTSWEGIS